ncbi:hypothetical protein [Citrobacter braakii]|uniref:hypothetical protein n=1 Tax=Citrobacter braakii TaxID=57706 RepID=UPI000D4C1787|nr:hypothetical protein [Citrobacter braakii]PPS47452.1 hypothetical protein BWR12_25410 [Citrobacter braakii]
MKTSIINGSEVSRLSVAIHTSIMREFPNGEKAHLSVMSAGFPSLTGDHKIVYVASDRDVSSEEILEAASKLLK